MASALYTSGFCNSPLWDERSSWNTAVPVLTPCFEDTVLVWIPVAVFWLAVYLRSYLLSGEELDKPGLRCTVLGVLRYVCSLCLLVLTCVFTLFEFIEGSPPATLLAGGLKTFTYGIVYLRLISDRQRGQSRHTMLWFFWLAMCLLELPAYYRMLVTTYGDSPLRTPPPTPSEFSGRVVTYPVLVIELVLFSLADSGDVEDNGSTSQSATAPSYAVFEWATSFLLSGYRKTLTVEDMLRPPKSLQARYNFDQWNAARKEELHPPFLIRTVFRLIWPRLLLGSLLYLSSSVLKVTAGLFLYLIIRHVRELAEESWKGYFYASVMFVVVSVSSLTLQHANVTLATLGIRIKALLATAVHRKTLRISVDALRHQASDIIGNISTDADSVSHFPSIIAIYVTVPVTVLYAAVLLWLFLGPPSLAAVVVAIVVVLIASLIAQRCHHILNQYSALKKTLFRYVGEFFSTPDAAKHSSLPEAMTAMNHEVSLANGSFAYWSAMMSAICTSAPFVISGFAFLPFILGNNFRVLTPSTAFLSVYLFDAMFMVLLALPELLSGSKNVRASADKIEACLLSNELEKYVVPTDEDQVAISVDNATLSWSPFSTRAVSDVTLKVCKGQLVAIVGPSGSGKSSLLSAITGNLVLEKGSVAVDASSTVAYVPQDPWIFNATLRQNILLGKSYDEDRYNTVLQVTCLKRVLKTLPQGDETLIGREGLSRDLKQRIGLARAVYQDRDIYLLDDPLCSVDVARTIYGNVVERGGILRDKTRLFASRGPTILTADAVVVLGEGGVKRSQPCRSSSKGDVDRRPMKSTCTAGQPDEDTPLLGKRTVLEDDTPSEVPDTKGPGTRRSSYFKYWAEAGVVIVVTALISLIASRVSTIGVGLWLSDVTQPLNQNPAFAAGIYFLLVALQAVFSAVATATVVKGSFSIARTVRDRVLHTVPHGFLSETSRDSVLKDVGVLDSQHPLLFSRVLEPFFDHLALTIFTSVYQPLFLLASITLSVLYRLVQSCYRRTIQQVKRIEVLTRRSVCVHLQDSIAGASTIRGCAMEEDFVRRFETAVEENHGASYSALISKLWTSTRLDVVGNVLTLVVAVILVSLRGAIGEEVGSVLMYYAMTVASYCFVNMAYGSPDVEATVASYERLRGLCRVETSSSGRPGGRDAIIEGCVEGPSTR